MQSWIPVLRLYFQSLIWYMESTYFNMGGEVVYCILVHLVRLYLCIGLFVYCPRHVFHSIYSIYLTRIFLIAILYYNRLILYTLLAYLYLVYLPVSTDRD